ncbi:MAG: L-2-hydroxyglutarate oxidase [Actinobacteria bacterium]|nr:MAG: L-2-hydroxyglutarate oxidase [Actinomycetota bacterium]
MSRRFEYDVCVIGTGLIGLGVASALAARFDGISMIVVDKETSVAAHQSGHNSGVVHSGLYYRPGSLKARLCVAGRREIEELCRDAGLPYRQTGKLVIATRPSDLPALDELERRGRENGLRGLSRIGPGDISAFEPAATGLAALHVPESGVTDFPSIARHLANRLERRGVEIVSGAEVTQIMQGESAIEMNAGEHRVTARLLINCGGLHSDLIAKMAGARPNVRIVPFRGEYYELIDEARDLVNTLIYPVPDPRFPFLGVHLTRRVDDTVEVGPNAVLALGREHYRDVPADWGELRSIIAHRGFRNLARRHLVQGAKEVFNSRSRALYARQARRLVPELRAGHLTRGGAGVRAQAVDGKGKLIDDFVIERAGRSVHILNAPSPGATASLAIGRHIAGLVKDDLAG